MRKNRMLILISCLLLPLNVLGAITTETCANGAGVVGTSYNGTKYCISKDQTFNWWNAYAWCESQRYELMDWTDCGCEITSNCVQNKCLGLNTHVDIDKTTYWTNIPCEEGFYVFRAYFGQALQCMSKEETRFHALCRMK